VKLADDDSSTLQVSGAITCRLQLADVQVEFQALILSGATAGFHVILCDTFFCKYSTSLQFSSKSLEINSNGLKYIVPNASFSKNSHFSRSFEDDQIFDGMSDNPFLSIIDAEEANSCIRKGARTALLWVRPDFVSFRRNTLNSDKKIENPITFACCPKSVYRAPALIAQTEFQNIIESYTDVFAEVPNCLRIKMPDTQFRWNQIRDRLFEIFIG
jgi:hypothetical protein